MVPFSSSADTLRMRIWSIGQVSKQMNVSYLAARQHVLHAESASDAIKAQAASKVSGTAIAATDVAGNDIYAAGAIVCGIKPSQFGDGTILKNLFAFITDPNNQAAAMKFVQFIMTIIALFPKAILPTLAPRMVQGIDFNRLTTGITELEAILPTLAPRMVQGIDFNRLTTGITELEAIQQDLSDKQTVAQASQSDLVKAQSAAASTVADVTTAQALFASEAAYLKKLIDQDPSAVDPAASPAPAPAPAPPAPIPKPAS